MKKIFNPVRPYLAIIGQKYIKIDSITFYPVEELAIQNGNLYFDYKGKTYGFEPDEDGICWKCFREEKIP